MRYSHSRVLLSCALALVLVLVGCDNSNPLSSSETPAPAIDGAETAIPGQYIVVLKDDAVQSKSSDAVRQLAQTILGKSAEIGHTYSAALTGFVAKGLSQKRVDALRSDSRIRFIEQDQVTTFAPPWERGGDDGGSTGQTTPWGITRVGGPVDGTGSVAWVIDTGVDQDHPDLNVDTQRSAEFVESGKGSKSVDDGNGHGTHVAGTIAAINNDVDVVGVAAGATVVGVKVLNDRGSGSYSAIIAGVDYTAQNAAAGDVANMSLGGGTSDALDSAVRNLADQGVYVALAAGNSSEDANLSSPSRVEYANVFTVSAMDDTDTFASFSNFGNPPIEYAAPGVDVLSTYADGGTSTLSGTSMASPHVAGILLMTNGSPNTDGTVSGDPDGDADPIATL